MEWLQTGACMQELLSIHLEERLTLKAEVSLTAAYVALSGWEALALLLALLLL